jgi:hypothetical protein
MGYGFCLSAVLKCQKVVRLITFPVISLLYELRVGTFTILALPHCTDVTQTVHLLRDYHRLRMVLERHRYVTVSPKAFTPIDLEGR